MNIESLQISLAEMLFKIREESVLEQVKNLLEKNTIVAYTVTGEPLTKSEYNKRLEEAEKSIKQGNTISTEDLRKEVKTWQK